MKRVLLIALIIVGFLGAIVFGIHALKDWTLLKSSTEIFYKVSVNDKASIQEIFKANAIQNIHRINLFAEVTWCLLSTIIMAIGIHGICCRKGN